MAASRPSSIKGKAFLLAALLILLFPSGDIESPFKADADRKSAHRPYAKRLNRPLNRPAAASLGRNAKPLKQREGPSHRSPRWEAEKQGGVSKKQIRVAIIVDDLGYFYGPLRELFLIEEPITLSIFPSLRYSKRIAQRAFSTGKGVMLHLPLEPYGYPEKDPGKGALFIEMSLPQVLDRLRQDLDSLPYLKGVNNHMGSRFMEDPVRMKAVMMELKRRGLFFVDSLTSSHSTGAELARELGVPWAKRDIFLDNVRQREAFFEQMDALIRIAKRKGEAIALCHPYRETILFLKEALPKLAAKGITIVPASELIK